MGLFHPLKTFGYAAAATAVITVCAIQWVAAAEENRQTPVPQERLGHDAAPRKPHRINRQNKTAFLTTLYDQLKTAPSEEAADIVAKAIERVWRQSGSDTADLLMERAGTAIQAKNFDLALQILSALVEITPDYAEGWNQLASVYFLQENYEKAMRGLRHVLTLEPQHYKAIEGLALILREMGDKKGALRATRRALGVYPHLKSAQQAEEELRRDVEGQGI